MEIKNPYLKSKRVRWGAILMSLMAALQAAGIVLNPWIAVGVYFAGDILTKRMDLNKK